MYPDREMWYSDYNGYVTREEFIYLEWWFIMSGKWPRFFPGFAYRNRMD